jgi:nucleoside-diphosphate-sugar epimerase
MTRPAVNPLAADSRLLIIGGGYSGQRLAAIMRSLGAKVQLTRREPRPGSSDLCFDSDRGLLPSAAALAGTTHVLVTAPPNRGGQDPCLASLKDLLKPLPLQWLGVLSTTGVYGDHGGAWVDETTAPALPLGARSAIRLACENAWLASGWPVTILRLPGIYGPGRNPLENLLKQQARLIHKPGQVFGRIHVDDIVGATLHLLSLPAHQRPALLNVVDNLPAQSSEPLGYAAHLLGCPLPPWQSFASICAELSPMALSFWQENRRVSNRLLTAELGYRLRYPTYREGLRACFKALEQRADQN